MPETTIRVPPLPRSTAKNGIELNGKRVSPSGRCLNRITPPGPRLSPSRCWIFGTTKPPSLPTGAENSSSSNSTCRISPESSSFGIRTVPPSSCGTAGSRRPSEKVNHAFIQVMPSVFCWWIHYYSSRSAWICNVFRQDSAGCVQKGRILITERRTDRARSSSERKIFRIILRLLLEFFFALR